MSRCRNERRFVSRIRLLVSDVDGTLVDKDKKLVPAVVDAVARLRAAGVDFTIISARPRSGKMPLTSHPYYWAAFAIVGDAKVDRWVFANDAWHASTDEGVHVAHERLASNQDPVVQDSFEGLLDKADKITFVSDDAALLRDLHERCAAQFADRATIVQSQTYYLDVTALQANKGDGITALTTAIGVPLTETAAIGDQANDLPMLALAAVSVAMGNAPDAVKAKAQHVSAGNDADGVAHAIDDIILKHNGVSA